MHRLGDDGARHIDDDDAPFREVPVDRAGHAIAQPMRLPAQGEGAVFLSTGEFRDARRFMIFRAGIARPGDDATDEDETRLAAKALLREPEQRVLAGSRRAGDQDERAVHAAASRSRLVAEALTSTIRSTSASRTAAS